MNWWLVTWRACSVWYKMILHTPICNIKRSWCDSPCSDGGTEHGHALIRMNFIIYSQTLLLYWYFLLRHPLSRLCHSVSSTLSGLCHTVSSTLSQPLSPLHGENLEENAELLLTVINCKGQREHCSKRPTGSLIIKWIYLYLTL